MRIALFAHDDKNHIGIVTDFGMLDFSRAFQAQQLIQHGDESPQLITDMVALMKAGLFNAETFESTMMFVYEHHLNGAFTVSDPTLRTPIPQPGKLIALGGNFWELYTKVGKVFEHGILVWAGRGFSLTVG